MRGKLYLIPTPISEDSSLDQTIPQYNISVLKDINYFVVENIRTARRFISKCKISKEIDSLHFVELNEHTSLQEIEQMIIPIIKGEDCAIMSEAGLPAVADPGSALVEVAHRHSIEVIPLTGPSSILLALMASGMNGQSFVFHGYIPIKQEARDKKIKEMMRDAVTKQQSQIFIEAPYRNEKLFETLIASTQEQIKLCVASNITSKEQYIKTLTLKGWRAVEKKPPINKIPTIFIIG